jgi:hypothetical protein
MATEQKIDQWNVVSISVDVGNGKVSERHALIVSGKNLNQLNQGFYAVPLIGEADLQTPEDQDIEIRSIRGLPAKEKHVARVRELFVLERASVLQNKGGLGRGERNAVRKLLKSFLAI